MIFPSLSRLKVCLLFTLIEGSLLSATDSNDLFIQANTAFVAGKYTDAIQNYESLLTQGYHSAAVFYNLANAYDRDGKIGPAILNYERALWMKPGDADIKANLQLVRRSAGIFESTPSTWQSIPDAFSLNTWLWIASLAFALLCITWIFHMLKVNIPWSPRPWIILLLLICMVSTVSSAIHIADLDRAVVLTPDTSLRVAPLNHSPSLFNLTAGAILRIQKQRDHFFYVRTSDGKMGWVSEKQVQPIIQKENKV